MIVLKPPSRFDLRGLLSVFLAGSIEMGAAENWQDEIQDALKHWGIIVLNPRRDDWDSTWEQSISCRPFREQVEWELKAQEQCDLIAMYFDPKTKSPISLLELGLFGQHKNKMIVCCPEGFWRKGNVDIVCNRYGITETDNMKDFIRLIYRRLVVLTTTGY